MLKNLTKPIPLLISLHAIVILMALFSIMRGAPERSSPKNQIVVIPIEGIISMEAGALHQGLTVESIVKKLKSIREDDDVKAVIFRINSPGGSVGAVQEIYREIEKLKEKGKIVVSSFQEVSASGGYYIAAAGDWIVLNPGTLTGSIGVIMQLPNVSGLFQKIGISMETIKSGAFKDAGSPFRQLTTKEKQYFTTVIMDSYQQFFDAVKKGRKMEDNALKELADGRIFSGQMAVQNKLADQLGGLEEAIEKAKSLAQISVKPQIVYYKGKPSWERLLQLLARSSIGEMVKLSNTSTPGLMYIWQP